MVMKTSWQLEEEERERDRKSLKFGGGLDVLNKTLQGIPGGLEGAIQWMNKGRDWQPDPENFNKLVNKNPVLKKAWKEFDTGSRQWTGKQLDKVQKSRKALDKWTYSNLDKVTGAVGEYNPTGKLSDAFTDIGNMVSGKYGATGPAKNIRDAIQQTRLDDPGQDPDLVRLSGKALTQHLKKFETPDERKAEALKTVVTDNRAEPGESKVDKSGYSWVDHVQEKLGYDRSNAPKSQVNTQSLTKKSKADFEKDAMDTWINKTRNSPAQRSGAFEKEELWNLHKKASPKWDEASTPVIPKPKPTEITDKTNKITEQVRDAKQQTRDTTSTNIGAKDLAGKLGGDFGKAYKMVQTGKALASVAKGTKVATAFGAGGAGSAGMAALGPLGIAAAFALAALSKKGEKEGSPNLRYRPGMVDDDFMV